MASEAHVTWPFPYIFDLPASLLLSTDSVLAALVWIFFLEQTRLVPASLPLYLILPLLSSVLVTVLIFLFISHLKSYLLREAFHDCSIQIRPPFCSITVPYFVVLMAIITIWMYFTVLFIIEYISTVLSDLFILLANFWKPLLKICRLCLTDTAV